MMHKEWQCKTTKFKKISKLAQSDHNSLNSNTFVFCYIDNIIPKV